MSDDPRVAALARWLIDAEQWRVTHAGLSDLEAACDEAGALIGRLSDILKASPLLEMTGVRQKAEATAAAVNHKWSEEAARQRRSLMALKRGVLDFGQVFLGPGSTHLAGDLAMRALGSPSLLDDKIPPARPYGGANRALEAAIKPQTVRFAHFMAGRNRSNWRSEHRRICPKFSDDTQNEWNRLLDKTERDACRRVGKLVGKNAPLSHENEAVAAAAMRHDAAELADMVRAHLRGGKTRANSPITRLRKL